MWRHEAPGSHVEAETELEVRKKIDAAPPAGGVRMKIR